MGWLIKKSTWALTLEWVELPNSLLVTLEKKISHPPQRLSPGYWQSLMLICRTWVKSKSVKIFRVQTCFKFKAQGNFSKSTMLPKPHWQKYTQDLGSKEDNQKPDWYSQKEKQSIWHMHAIELHVDLLWVQWAVCHLPWELVASTLPKLLAPTSDCCHQSMHLSNHLHTHENCTVVFIFKKNWLREISNKMQECLIGILLAEGHKLPTIIHQVNKHC